MAKERLSIRKIIEQNKDNIQDLLSSSSIWMAYFQWIQRQLVKENERLFPKDKTYLYYSKERKMRRNCLASSIKYIFNHNDAIDVIDYNQIRTIHKLVSEGSEISGGTIRQTEVNLQSLNIYAPNTATGIYHKLEEISYNLSRTDNDPISKAFQIHYDIIATQPFEDCNKRAARLIMNWILLKSGFSPVLFDQAGDRNLYLDAIRCKNCGPKKEYERIFANVLLRSQHNTIEYLYKFLGKLK